MVVLTEKQSTLRIFSKQFFSSFILFNSYPNVSRLDLTELKPTLEKIALHYAERKNELCKTIDGLTVEECEQLEQLVQAENDFLSLGNGFEKITKEVINPFQQVPSSELVSFFSCLDQFLFRAPSLWSSEYALLEELSEYFSNVASYLLEGKAEYEQIQLTPESLVGEPCSSLWASPFELYSLDEKLAFFRRMDLFQLLMDVFIETSNRLKDNSVNLQDWLAVNQKFVHYNDLFEEGDE